ncbi:acyl-CoA carboxylase subunit beta [Brevibacterium jeotgali]|nr:carboxyl transferase domain-containing protein [Brevibacterium jeotgali]TWC03237.1 acetyl-CoA carboxylase carboxyltransferase component [Brevibacterium jeotgali]
MSDSIDERPATHESTTEPHKPEPLWWETEIAARTAYALGMGGQENIERQHQRGQLTARERVDKFVDEDTWREVGMFTGKGEYDVEHRLTSVTPANVIVGTGRVDGREVALCAEDFTVRGGSSESTSPDKWQYIERFALQYRIPMVRLIETAGGSINILKQSGATKIPGYSNGAPPTNLGTIPVVAIALGAAAGFGAVRVVRSHFSVMVAGSSYVFAGGPAVVKPGVGQEIDKEELGGASVHARGSGVVDNEAKDEEDAFEQARRFLSYLPSSVFELPPVHESDDDPERRDEALATLVPESKRRSYSMRKIMESVFDTGSIFEIGRYNGRSQITALARINGHPVAVLANDPSHLGGSLTAEASEKLIRFVDMADTFHLPVINLVDQPGTYVGREAEAKGTVRLGIRAQLAIEQAQVPWATVFVRRAFGLAGSAYGPLMRLVNWRVAWPSAYWGSIPIEGGVEAAYKKEIAAADDPQARRDELVKSFEYLENPFLTAEKFGINDIIDPRETRPMLSEWVTRAYRLLPELLGVTTRTMRS